MKKYLLLISCCFMAAFASAQGYTISLKSNYRSGIAYLTYYMGKDYLLQDSAAVSNTGIAVFKGSKKLPAGIYSIVFPGKKYTADFLIEKEQQISIAADTAQLSKMIVTGSPANNDFKAYKAFVDIKGTQLEKEKTAYSLATTRADSALHEENYKKYSKELNDYRDNIVKTKPNSMMSALLLAMKESPRPTKIPRTRQDSLDNYNYYKEHYWDGVSFMDERVIRTPFFLPKLQSYYHEVLSQVADTLEKDIDYRLLLARSNPEMYKFLLNWFTDEYINPKFMGQDAVFVHLFEKYHSQGISTWLSDKQHEAITRRAYMLMSNLIGERAANLQFSDTSGSIKSLYEVDAPFIVMVFWDPSCGHCKEEIPKIDSIYRASWKAKGVKIYAVLSETEKQKPSWLAYIREHHIEDWINVYQSAKAVEEEEKAQMPSFRQLYDITLTPTLYLLDKDKNIIAKKLTYSQINGFLEVKMKQ